MISESCLNAPRIIHIIGTNMQNARNTSTHAIIILPMALSMLIFFNFITVPSL